jgi:hypothetical protein
MSVVYESEVKTKEESIKEAKLNQRIVSIGFRVASINYQSILNAYAKNKYNEQGFDYLNRRNNRLLRYAGDVINLIDENNREFDYRNFSTSLDEYKGSIDDQINQFISDNAKIISEYKNTLNESDDYFFQVVAYTHFLLRIIYDSY